MSDHHTAGSLRHHADKNVTVPTKPRSQIGILGDGFVRKMSAGQQVRGSSRELGVRHVPRRGTSASPPASALGVAVRTASMQVIK
ncbi:MAG: hypothetical protein ACREP9_17365 [Candidatus Dormibacteraceae bacterium]